MNKNTNYREVILDPIAGGVNLSTVEKIKSSNNYYSVIHFKNAYDSIEIDMIKQSVSIKLDSLVCPKQIIAGCAKYKYRYKRINDDEVKVDETDPLVQAMMRRDD